MSESEQVSSTIAEAGSTTEATSIDADVAMKDTNLIENLADQPNGSAAEQPPIKSEINGAPPAMMVFDPPTTATTNEQESILPVPSPQPPLQNRNTSSIHVNYGRRASLTNIVQDILNADSPVGSGSNTPTQASLVTPATAVPTPPVGQPTTTTGEVIRSQGAHVREYLNENITPFLVDGMKRLARERPENPLEWLGRYLIEQSDKPQSDTQPLPPAI